MSNPVTNNPPTGNPGQSSVDPNAKTTTVTQPPTTSSKEPPTTTSTTSTPVLPPTTTSSTSTEPPTTTSSTPTTTTTSIPSSTTTSSTPITTPSSTTSIEKPPTTVVTVQPSETSTVIQTVTSSTTSKSAPTTTSTSATPTRTAVTGGKGASGGLSSGAKVAIGVVVPIAAIAILAILALFWWKKRRARREEQEERRKEVEDYAYNPNADPTIPAVGLAADNSYEMREDGTSGYRGWGSTTNAGSTGRKASTTMSGGVPGGAFSDATGPTARSHPGDPADGSYSPEGEILGAMGPSAANNRHGDVRRGPSNASSSYSVTGRSEGSDGGMGYGGGGQYYDQYAQNPYVEGEPTQELPGQPIIRDNPARRNTRIENPSHFPQQSAGIAQNF